MEEQKNYKYGDILKPVILIIGLLLILYAGRFLHLDVDSIQNFLLGFPLFAVGFLYILLYVIITFFIWFSKDAFWLVGALAFGPVISAVLVWAAEIINAFILFYLARFLGRGFVERKLKTRHSKFDESIARLNFGWLLVFRAAPLVPYRFMDLSAGLTGIPVKKYILAVILGSPVKIFWVQFVLSGVGRAVLRDPFAISEYFLKNKFMLWFSAIYIIFVILVLFKLMQKGRSQWRQK